MSDTSKDTEYIFTFGLTSPNLNKFVAIPAKDYYTARAIMVKNFGLRWSAQYESRYAAGVLPRKLIEIPLTEEQRKLPRRSMH